MQSHVYPESKFRVIGKKRMFNKKADLLKISLSFIVFLVVNPYDLFHSIWM